MRSCPILAWGRNWRGYSPPRSSTLSTTEPAPRQSCLLSTQVALLSSSAASTPETKAKKKLGTSSASSHKEALRGVQPVVRAPSSWGASLGALVVVLQCLLKRP